VRNVATLCISGVPQSIGILKSTEISMYATPRQSRPRNNRPERSSFSGSTMSASRSCLCSLPCQVSVGPGFLTSTAPRYISPGSLDVECFPDFVVDLRHLSKNLLRSNGQTECLEEKLEENEKRAPLGGALNLLIILAPQVRLELTTLRLTAECSAIELLRNMARPETN
jgi:hypothetical protein